jgi:hypothetical protein
LLLLQLCLQLSSLSQTPGHRRWLSFEGNSSACRTKRGWASAWGEGAGEKMAVALWLKYTHTHPTMLHIIHHTHTPHTATTTHMHTTHTLYIVRNACTKHTYHTYIHTTTYTTHTTTTTHILHTKHTHTPHKYIRHTPHAPQNTPYTHTTHTHTHNTTPHHTIHMHATHHPHTHHIHSTHIWTPHSVCTQVYTTHQTKWGLTPVGRQTPLQPFTEMKTGPNHDCSCRGHYTHLHSSPFPLAFPL